MCSTQLEIKLLMKALCKCRSQTVVTVGLFGVGFTNFKPELDDFVFKGSCSYLLPILKRGLNALSNSLD